MRGKFNVKGKIFIFIIISSILLIAFVSRYGKPDYVLWVANPLTNVFRDHDYSGGEITNDIYLEAARNEYESFQICVTARTPLTVGVHLHPFLHSSGYSIGSENLRYEFVEYVPVRHNTSLTGENDLLRKALGEFPDPLLKREIVEVRADETRAIWFTLFIPPGVPSGKYESRLEIIVDDDAKVFNLHLDVHPFELPEKGGLWVTNWFGVDRIAQFHGVELWSEDFWQILRLYARNMAEHRQNIAWVDPNLIKTYLEENSSLSFDYSNFDRFVELFESEGVMERIEIRHLASKIKAGEIGSITPYGPEVKFNEIPVFKREDNSRIYIPPEEVLESFLPSLQRHLEEKGWLNKSMIHIADEPDPWNLDSYNDRSALVNSLAPGIKRMDATLFAGLEADLDILVPILDHFDRFYENYLGKMRENAEVWFYTCCWPTGKYPNRFIDFALIKTRILHWLNFRYGAVGYLHWGWNGWTENPFENVEVGQLPPGNSFIVYPGLEGPLNSIRWEQMREGLEDYEYLCLLQKAVGEVGSKLGVPLEEYDPSLRPKEFCSLLINTPTDYEKNPERLFEVRHKIASEIIELEKRPFLLVKTSPSSISPIKPGLVELKGWVEEGASVRVNGEEVEVGNGVFSKVVTVSPQKNGIEVVATLENHSKIWTVEFKFKKSF